MFSGSYRPDDVEFLLRPIELAETPLEEKERLIQSGRRHYSEMITRERLPSAAYLRVFHEGLNREKGRLARDVLRLAALIAAQRTGPVTLVSLARAGTPVGVLLARTLRRHLGRPAHHYSVSIIRDRGIDRAALDHIFTRHGAESVAFIDGWTGKGVIAAELERAVRAYGAGLDAGLFAVADLSGTAAAAATADDYLIPSCVLGATVSGLVSRSILNDDVARAGGFHGCLHYREYEREDLSRWFVDVMSEEIARCAGESLHGGVSDDERIQVRARSVDFVALAQRRYGVRDVNFVKPGIGEATRVLLRRVPDRLLLREPGAADVAHLELLAAEKGVPVEREPTLPYLAAAIIKGVDA